MVQESVLAGLNRFVGSNGSAHAHPPHPPHPAHAPFLLVGGSQALDFINTRLVRDGELLDLLATWSDVVRWAAAVGLCDAAVPHADHAHTSANTSTGSSALADALALREAVRTLVHSTAAGAPPDAAAIDIINRAASRSPNNVRLIFDARGLRRECGSGAASPAVLLGAVALDAIDLLTQRDRARLRKCASPECSLFFFDISRNGKRRWCSMSGCGNRSKARGYYLRKRGQNATSMHAPLAPAGAARNPMRMNSGH